MAGLTKPVLTGVILAGGRARRMDGRDKGLIEVAGRPLVEWVCGRLRPQVDDLVISANRHQDRYLAFADAVVADEESDYPGPLAGIAATLAVARNELVLVVPCDSPLFPTGLGTRLMTGFAATTGSAIDACVAHDGERLQPLFGIYRRTLVDDIRRYLARGGRKVEDWLAGVTHVRVSFAGPAMFHNANTPADLDRLADALLHS